MLSQILLRQAHDAIADDDRKLALLIRNVGLTRPEAVFVEEIEGHASLAAACSVALHGALVVVGLNVPDVPAAFRWLSAHLPEENGKGLAHDVVEALGLVVARRMLPAEGGGKVPCHAFAAVRPEDRPAWHGTKPEGWHSAAVATMDGMSGTPHETFATSASKLFANAEISRSVRDHVRYA